MSYWFCLATVELCVFMRMASAVRIFYFLGGVFMNENNLSVKATSNYNAISTNNGFVFDQRKFISDIYECEKQKYILEKRLNLLLHKIKQKSFCPDYCDTNFYKRYDKESKNHRDRPPKPKMESYSWPEELFLAALKGVPCGIVFTVLHLIVHMIVRGSLMSFELGFGTIIAIIVTIIVAIRNKKMLKKNYIERMNAYKENCKKAKEDDERIDKYNMERSNYWENEYEKYCNKIKNSAKQYEALVMPEINEIRTNLNLVNNTLKTLYNLRINGVLCLHPNYQGIVPISVIHGYFDTGRCSQLQGHEGAYNLYEDEKMKGMIINKLDVVSKQIGKLNSTMVYVGQAINECNDRLSSLESTSERMISSVNSMNNNVTKQLNGVSNQMSAIESNTANSAYYAEVGAKMATFNTVYNMLKD